MPIPTTASTRLRGPGFFLLATLLLLGCGPSSAKPGYATGPTKAQAVLPTAVLACNSIKIVAELATTASQRESGLMFRKTLEPGKGMLFVFEADQVLAFWMRNTTIPLSLAYISLDGTIRDIRDLEPLSEAPVSSTRSVRYALEVPQGWFAQVGIKEGDRLELPPRN